MYKPTFSIIIPAYNEEKNIASCLDSINGIDYPRDKYEVIVVDNGSTDSTRYIAAQKGATIIRNDYLNVSGLRNYGAKKSKGEILAFVDADCVVFRDWLSFAATYSTLKDVAAWGAPPTIPKDASWVSCTWYLIRKKDKPIQEVDWLESMNLLVRKDQFFSAGGFNERLKTCEDVDFCYRIKPFGKIISDNRLRVVHYGEASTLREFIKKEIWRGSSNIKGFFSHRFSLKELPSALIPIYFGVLLPVVLLLALIYKDPIWFFAFTVLFMLPGIAVLIKVRKKIKSFSEAAKLIFLLIFYFISRTIAIFKRS
jgi:glycosyltransferase involved in cell wall biosynthesis